MLGVVLVSVCTSSSFFRIVSSLLSSGAAFLKISACVFVLESCSVPPESCVSQPLHMATTLLIFCKSWVDSMCIVSMRSPLAHILTCSVQLGVKEKKKVCRSTSPKKSSLGPCSINWLNLFQVWSLPSSSPCVKVITCLLRCWTLLIGKNLSQNFFVNLFQFT
jgi:hypothetical protein